MITLTRTSTDNTETPETITFDTWNNYPQLPRKVIEYTRRLGSHNIIRQEVGIESNPTICNVTKSFDNEYDSGADKPNWAVWVDEVSEACDPTTFYTFENETNFEIPRCMLTNIVGYTTRAVRGYSPGTTAPTDQSDIVIVQMQLEVMVDSAGE